MIGHLPSRPSGSSAAARFHQTTYDARQQHDLRASRGGNVSRTTRGSFVSTPRQASTAIGAFQYALTDASQPDYFVGRFIRSDGFCSDRDSYIAKPYQLRRTVFDTQEVDVTVELWDGVTLTTEVRTYSFVYKSATFRLKTDTGSSEEESQAIIPRFVPAEIDEETGFITNEGPTIIYAVECGQLSDAGGDDKPLRLLALNDSWAWAKVESP